MLLSLVLLDKYAFTASQITIYKIAEFQPKLLICFGNEREKIQCKRTSEDDQSRSTRMFIILFDKESHLQMLFLLVPITRCLCISYYR